MIALLTSRPLFSWLPLIALSLGSIACGRSEAAEAKSEQKAAVAPATAKPQVTVKLGYQKFGAPFLLKARSADLERRLGEHSAKPEWKEFKHGPALLEAINAGEVDVGHVGETPPVFAQAAGVQFVYLATDPPAPKAEAILVKNDSPLKSVADLKGKKVALNRGSNVHYLLVKALEKQGLTLKDVEVVYLAPGDARPAFETGKVDAWVIWNPFLADAVNAGARVLTDGQGLVDNYLFYVARRGFAEQHPDLVKLVLDEFQTLSAWESKNPEETARLTNASSGIAYEALLASERSLSFGLLPITPEILDKQQNIANVFRKLELIPKDIRLSDAFLPSAAYAPKP
jgi:sulfonate transport system substrate-binding protein